MPEMTAADALRGRGFAPVPRDDTRPWNFVLGDDAGRQVDFDVLVFDERGHGVHGPPENGEVYPAEALTGHGSVGRGHPWASSDAISTPCVVLESAIHW